jgi:flagellar hook-associated protein 3 FlgL
MQTPGYGDLASTLGRQAQISAIKRTIDQRSQETVSGRMTDPAAAARGQLGPITAIETSLERLRGWDANVEATSRQLGAMQLVFNTIEAYALPAREGLMAASSTGNEAQVRVALADARDKLDGVLSLLNTRAGERSIFSGTATATNPFEGGAQAVIDALQGVVAGAGDAQSMIAAVDAWFDDPAGFSATLYRGGDQTIGPVPIGNGQTVSIGVTGDHPSIRSTIKAFAIAAVAIDAAPDGADLLALSNHAARALLASASDRALAEGTLGLAEGQIEVARNRNAAERTALQLSQAALLNVDAFESASALSEAQQQLEMMFATTARLSRLSLLNYL